jgi:hypothetical protein
MSHFFYSGEERTKTLAGTNVPKLRRAFAFSSPPSRERGGSEKQKRDGA